MKHYHRALVGGLFIVGAVFFNTSSPANAQTIACGARPDLVNKLDQSFSEKPVSMGLSSNGAVVEVFASQIGTFSIVITRSDGVACLVSAGEGWENIPTVTAKVQS